MYKQLHLIGLQLRQEQFKLFWTSGEPHVGEAGSHSWSDFKKRHASKLGVVNSEKYANLFQKREEEKEEEEEEEDIRIAGNGLAVNT